MSWQATRSLLACEQFDMKIVDKLRQGSPSFSFEFFPPKDEAGMDRLFSTIQDLRGYQPTYVSVTYGAGGSTRRLTVDLVCRIQTEVGLDAMAHLTCVGADRMEIKGVLDQLQRGGIQNVLPLRGDPPRGSSQFKKVEGGFGYAAELIEFIRPRYDFCLAAACYPEGHPEAPSIEQDVRFLKAKVEAGVDFLITQLFFDNRDYFSFMDRVQRVGIKVPILAGIMPITNTNQIKRFTAMCGAKIPAHLAGKLDAAGADLESVQKIGVEHATVQCRELLEQGAPGIHFYTLNRSRATVRVLEALRASA